MKQIKSRPTGKHSSVEDKEASKDARAMVRLGAQPVRLARLLIGIVCVLILAGLLSHLLRFGFGFKSALGFIKLFDLNQEANVPTWFSSALLAGCAVLLALTAAAEKVAGVRWYPHWAMLAVIFVLMSLDEIASIHERFMEPIRMALGLGGLLTNAWVVLAFILLPVLLLFYARFLFALPRRSRWLFVFSGAIYVGGVVGVEMVSGAMKSTYGMDDLRFALTTTLEESLEMLGLTVFIYSLADHAAREQLSWCLSFGAATRIKP